MPEHGVTEIDIKLVPRLTSAGRAFTEVLMRYSEVREVVDDEGDVTSEVSVHHTLSRMNYTVADTPHSRSCAWQQFLQRRRRCRFDG
jgi:hypothetical protein